MIATVHHLAAPALAVTAALLLLLLGFAAVRHRPIRVAADRAILLALAVVAFGIVTGAGTLVANRSGPADPLHFVYALVALAALPVARFWDRLAGHRALSLGVAAVVLAAMALRLFQTG